MPVQRNAPRRRRNPNAMSPRFRAWLCFALVFASYIPAAGAQGSDPPVSLSSLEQRIDQAPGLLANAQDIEAAQQSVRATRDASGLAYAYNADFGPAAIIVPRSYDQHVLRFEQTLGLQLPLLGTATAQYNSVLGAQEKEAIARVTLDQARRLRLATLREAYVNYWQYDVEGSISQDYLNATDAEMSKARALRRTGFWTATNMLDFLDTIQRVRSDQQTSVTNQHGQLALIQSAVGVEVPAFRPVAPEFYNSCAPNRTLALESAFNTDATLATLSAQNVQVRSQLAKVHGSTINATASGQAGSVTDINVQQSGYDVTAAINLALPTHARDEERALRAQYAAQLTSISLQEEQRRVEISSILDSLLANVQSAQTTLEQAQTDVATRKEDLRKAIVAYNTVRLGGSTGFDQVHEMRDELYLAQRTAAIDEAGVLLQANQVLALAPGACGGEYHAMPVFTIPPKPTPKPRPVHTPKPAVQATAKPARTPAPRTILSNPRVPSPRPNPTPIVIPTPQPLPTLVATPVPAPSALPTLIPAPTPGPKSLAFLPERTQSHSQQSHAQTHSQIKKNPQPWIGGGFFSSWLGAGYSADANWLGWGYNGGIAEKNGS